MTSNSRENRELKNKVEEENKMKSQNKAVDQQEINEVLKIYEKFGYPVSELSEDELEIISLRNYKMKAEKEKMDIQFNTIQDILILTGNDKMYGLQRISETECDIYTNEPLFPYPFLSGKIEEIRKFLEKIINPNK